MRIGWVLATGLIALAVPFAAQAGNWKVEDGPPLRLALSYGDQGVDYRFACAGDHVTIVETGVTQLMDPGTGAKVSDAPGATMLPGAAVMGLYVDGRKIDLVPARATANTTKGWNLAIDMPLKDPTLQALRKTKSMSLMTTGWTGMVELGPDDRKVIGGFLDRCAGR
ncbi:MAG TPA: hypothetical protein VG407_12725 [Caulobacteraceae bacterium]|jgi:hypothetical protein|nr:hypothetical protein [Caulobacteraceae bacterium]